MVENLVYFCPPTESFSAIPPGTPDLNGGFHEKYLPSPGAHRELNPDPFFAVSPDASGSAELPRNHPGTCGGLDRSGSLGCEPERDEPR